MQELIKFLSAGSYHKMSSPPSTTAFPYSFHWRIRVRRWLKGMQLQTCYTRINHRLVQLHKLPSTINNIRLQRKKKKSNCAYVMRSGNWLEWHHLFFSWISFLGQLNKGTRKEYLPRVGGSEALTSSSKIFFENSPSSPSPHF